MATGLFLALAVVMKAGRRLVIIGMTREVSPIKNVNLLPKVLSLTAAHFTSASATLLSVRHRMPGPRKKEQAVRENGATAARPSAHSRTATPMAAAIRAREMLRVLSYTVAARGGVRASTGPTAA